MSPAAVLRAKYSAPGWNKSPRRSGHFKADHSNCQRFDWHLSWDQDRHARFESLPSCTGARTGRRPDPAHSDSVKRPAATLHRQRPARFPPSGPRPARVAGAPGRGDRVNAMNPPFPCPFCDSALVLLVGEGRRFLHYRCGECAEVWTAQADTPISRARTAGAVPLRRSAAVPEVLQKRPSLSPDASPAAPLQDIRSLVSRFENQH